MPKAKAKPRTTAKPDTAKSLISKGNQAVSPDKSPFRGKDQSPIDLIEINSGADQDLELVKETLRAIMRDQQAPAAAKAQAARTLAEMVGGLGRNARPPVDPGKPLSEMTREELEAELAASEAR